MYNIIWINVKVMNDKMHIVKFINARRQHCIAISCDKNHTMLVLMTTLERTIIYQIIDVGRKTCIKDIACVPVVDLFIK